MAVLEIRHFPDSVLTRRAASVEKITPAIDRLIDDMVETMYFFPNTIGLAAPQVGHSIRLIVLDVTPKEKKHGLLILLNPRIVHQSEDKVLREGCLSLPDYTGNVRRYNRVEVEAVDREGSHIRVSTAGIEAICLQHEIDHVDGMLFIHRVDSLKTDVFRRKRYGK